MDGRFTGPDIYPVARLGRSLAVHNPLVNRVEPSGAELGVNICSHLSLRYISSVSESIALFT